MIGFKYVCNTNKCDEVNNVKTYTSSVSRYDHEKKEVVSEHDECPTCKSLRVEVTKKSNGYPTNTRGFRPNEGHG